MGRRPHDGDGGAEREEQADDEAGPVDDHGGELPLVADVVVLVVPTQLGGDLTQLLQDGHHVVAHIGAVHGLAVVRLGNRGVHD